MSAAEIKASIYKMLDATEDNTVLEDIHKYIAQRKDGYVQELGCTREEYSRELEEADAEIQRGNYATHEEVRAEVDALFKSLRHEAEMESGRKA